jgi:hypothetical protein
MFPVAGPTVEMGGTVGMSCSFAMPLSAIWGR